MINCYFIRFIVLCILSFNLYLDSDLINANLPGCSCCNQNIKLELSHKCIECKRHYHDYCHIPRIPSHYLNDE